MAMVAFHKVITKEERERFTEGDEIFTHGDLKEDSLDWAAELGKGGSGLSFWWFSYPFKGTCMRSKVSWEQCW